MSDDRGIRHPAFTALCPWYTGDIDGLTLDRLNAFAGGSNEPPCSAAGAPIVFVRPSSPLRALDYEAGILRTGAVPTRDRSRHDAFNALCWIAFPQFKQACNAIHVAHGGPQAAASRGRVRDAVTLLDESGVIVLCAQPEMAEMLRQRQWKKLFWERRDDMELLQFLVCGHGLFEKLLSPYPGITAKALIIEVPRAVLQDSVVALRRFADTRAAARLNGGILAAHLPPLPLMGIPGWHAANATAEFYDDRSIFRPGHRATAEGSASTDAHSASAPAAESSAGDP